MPFHPSILAHFFQAEHLQGSVNEVPSASNISQLKSEALLWNLYKSEKPVSVLWIPSDGVGGWGGTVA